MRIRFAFLLLGSWLMVSCDDAPPSAVITDPLPLPEPSVHIIDTDYHVQFTWGKGTNNDTVTMEIPDDGEEYTEDQYITKMMEYRSEPVKRLNELDPDKVDTVGWHYAPSTIVYPYSYAEFFQPTNGQDVDLPLYEFLPDPYAKPFSGANGEEMEMAYRNIFWITFPWRTLDTIEFWDIADYLSNPAADEGPGMWGRVGNNVESDSLWNDDARNGVVLHYIDEDGNLWESDNPPNFQPFGYFEIDRVTQNFKDERSYFIIEGVMAARLYNDQKEFKELMGGKFKLIAMDDIPLSDQPE